MSSTEKNWFIDVELYNSEFVYPLNIFFMDEYKNSQLHILNDKDILDVFVDAKTDIVKPETCLKFKGKVNKLRFIFRPAKFLLMLGYKTYSIEYSLTLNFKCNDGNKLN